MPFLMDIFGEEPKVSCFQINAMGNSFTITDYMNWPNCPKNVIIPNGITTIGTNAFQGNNLQSVHIPESVLQVGNYAFSGNSSLDWVYIPNPNVSIGTNAFPNGHIWGGTRTACFEINNINGMTVTDYKDIDANGIACPKNVVIPKGIVKIGSQAFRNKTLQAVDIPNTVTQMDNEAFQGNLLTEIDIPDNITEIKNSVFKDNLLTEINIPDGVTRIESFAFSNNSITLVHIPMSVNFIDNNAFSNNTDLTLVYIANPSASLSVVSGAFPNGVVWGGTRSSCFEFNTLNGIMITNYLTSDSLGACPIDVVIPYGVTVIGTSAFENKSLTSVEIPESVTEIKTLAFSNNDLESITVPNNVVTLGSSIFSNNNNLISAEIENDSLSIGNDVFDLGVEVTQDGSSTLWLCWGTGTETDPIVICTYEALKNIANGLDKYYVIGQDIDATASWSEGDEVEPSQDSDNTNCTPFNQTNPEDTISGWDVCTGWAPIGDDTNPFQGNLDGQGFKISNLFISPKYKYGTVYVGIFGYIGANAEISNLVIENIYMYSVNLHAYNHYVGGLVGYNNEGSISYSRIVGGVI